MLPPDGSLVWNSPELLTEYDFHYFVLYIRAAPRLLRQLLAKLDGKEAIPFEVANLVEEKISNCAIKALCRRRLCHASF